MSAEYARSWGNHAGREFLFKFYILVADDDSFRLSRKDALKRHIENKHPLFRKLLKNLALKILVPRRKNVPENIAGLRQAMSALPVT